MTDLPPPLVPPHVDLTDFPFMPLMIAKLKQSRAWLICKRRPEMAFYLQSLDRVMARASSSIARR